MEALVEADLCPNPYPGTHERDVQWVETLPWVLQTHVDGTVCQDLETVLFCTLEGIDTYASVVVNDGVVRQQRPPVLDDPTL